MSKTIKEYVSEINAAVNLSWMQRQAKLEEIVEEISLEGAIRQKKLTEEIKQLKENN